MVHRHTMCFNIEMTGQLGVYLNTALQFKIHKSLILYRTRMTENRV